MHSYRRNYASFILGKVSLIIEEHLARELKIMILNDLASILYGLVKPVGEIRLLVDGKDLYTTTYIVSNVLGMSAYEKDILGSLNKLGIAVLNPVLVPLTIIETPRKDIDHMLLDEPNDLVIDGYRIILPRIEYYIAKLFSYGAYPYNIYALIHLIAYTDLIEPEKFRKAFEKTGIDPKTVIKDLKNIGRLISVFPELNEVGGNIDKLVKILDYKGYND